MVLSDVDITHRVKRGDLTVTPFVEDNVEPASIDLRLGEEFKKAREDTHHKVSLNNADNTDDTILWEQTSGNITVKPYEFVLASTREYVEMPETLVAKVEGRSSLGRLGVSIHQTAGYIDPGFCGQITLEITNLGPVPVELETGDRVCQIRFSELSQPAETTYGHTDSQYQNQSGPTQSGMSFN